MLDQVAANIFAKNVNMMVPWYLMASYAYYEESDPIFTDQFFDDMGKTMLQVWDDIEHFHKELISRDDLNAGTYLGEYPERVKGGLKSVRETFLTKSGEVRKKYVTKK